MLFGVGPQIKNIAADLNKLFRQGSLLNQSGQTVEGDSTADQGTSDLLAARDPVIQEISVGMSGEQSAWYTVSGTPPLSLPNSLGKPLKAWSVDVLPKQDLHGYDAPWPAGGGVNKFDETTGTYGDWIDGSGNVIAGAYGYISDKIKVSDSGTYCYKYYGIAPYSAGLVEYANDDSFVKRTISINGYGTVALQSETAYIRLIVSSPNGTQSTMTQEQLISCKMMVTANSFADAYSPYSNICPIYGTDKLNLFVEESYDQSATPKAVLTLPQTVYTGTIGSEGGESRSVLWTANTSTMDNGEDYPGWKNSGIREILGAGRGDNFQNQRMNIGNQFNINTIGTNDILFLSKQAYHLTQSEWKAMAVDVQIEVILPASTQFPLTAPTIPTPTGTATTWATAEDGTVDGMEVTYVGKA